MNNPDSTISKKIKLRQIYYSAFSLYWTSFGYETCSTYRKLYCGDSVSWSTHIQKEKFRNTEMIRQIVIRMRLQLTDIVKISGDQKPPQIDRERGRRVQLRDKR